MNLRVLLASGLGLGFAWLILAACSSDGPRSAKLEVPQNFETGTPIQPCVPVDAGFIIVDAGDGGDGGGIVYLPTGCADTGVISPPVRGEIRLVSTTLVAGDPDTTAYGAEASFLLPKCTDTTIGACTYSQCNDAIDAGIPLASGNVNVGTITLAAPSKSLTLTPNAKGLYPTVTGAGQLLWNNSGTVVVSAPGSARLPSGFSASVDVPKPIELLFPQLPKENLDQIAPIARTAAYDLTWNAIAQGTLEVSITIAHSALICEFKTQSGSASIPISALQKLPSGSGHITILSRNRDTVGPTDGVTINVDVASAALQSSRPFDLEANIE